jgi:hypothetical protein
MRRTRHVIAVMVVATALCADRAVSAAPQARTPAPSFATRIARSFGQSVPSVRVQLQPARIAESAKSFPLPIREAASGVRDDLSPFQFRLPPPTR